MTEYDKSIVQRVIRDLSFAPNISISEFSMSIIEYVEGHKYFEYLLRGENSHLLKTKKVNVYRKLDNILSRLVLDEDNDKTTTELISSPKRYDEILYKKQKSIYNRTIRLIDYPLIKKKLSEKQLKNILIENSDLVDYDLIARFYPYFVYEDNKGFSFLEYMIIFNIYLTTSTRALNTLCKPIRNSRDRKRAEKLVEEICNSISSPNTYKTYVDLFFNVLYDKIHKKYLYYTEDYVRRAWLPEKYSKRKDAFRAFEKYKKYQAFDNIHNGTPIEQQFLFLAMDKSFYFERTLTDVIPLAWNIMYNSYGVNGKILDHSFSLDDEDSQVVLLSKEYIKVIRAYIRENINCAQTIIKKLLLEDIDNK